jgi:hypothetical protein
MTSACQPLSSEEKAALANALPGLLNGFKIAWEVSAVMRGAALLLGGELQVACLANARSTIVFNTRSRTHTHMNLHSHTRPHALTRMFARACTRPHCIHKQQVLRPDVVMMMREGCKKSCRESEKLEDVTSQVL